MKLTSEFSVSFKSNEQITPDDFRVISPTLKITETTTIKQILDWYRKFDKYSPMEIKIVQMQETE